ncbi:MAG: hypothetical protein KGQ60_18300 [Planctomycetes bacterium]|nr:hypothetical protein [Planctomycetota bacterium]NBO91394.1 hypothetical protein [Planctomycetia bacterium]
MFLLLLFAAPTICLEGGTIVINGLDPKTVTTADVAVFVEPRSKDQPCLLGETRRDGGKIVFVPRFPLTAGVKFRVVVGGSEIVIGAPKIEKDPVATVRVFPSADVLPENQLKFYLHFSVPMSQGDVYRHIQLLDDKGKPVELPFLELDQELWDASGKRFTLFFDPGRIKRGLKPREEVGPALVEGRSYTLVIKRDWRDEDGTPMKATFTKGFKVAPPDDSQPDHKTWKISPPIHGDDKPLRVTFPKPMDHALTQRMIWVTDVAGKRIAGEIELSDHETVWTFKSVGSWRSGDYFLVADTRLEDLAGNCIARPFEVDILRPVEKKITAQTVRVPFRVK